ncbi:MAG: hypothetical protein K0R61_4202 [Microvirga sp.]|jgi:hypothetical protein|nr:hypothetical protein [Microvirga sp.]MDF2973752.1 hypothetical protein [Microvirga sp.]
MSRRVSWAGIVSVLLVLVTGSGPVSAQEPRRNMFDGLFGPPLRTPPSFSRPQATLPGTILLDSLRPQPDEVDNSAAENEAPPAPAEPEQADSTATAQAHEGTSISGPAPQHRPDAVKERSVQKRFGAPSSQVRPNRRSGARPIIRRLEAKSRAEASGTTRANREARGSAAARTASVRGPRLIGGRRPPGQSLKKADAVLRFSGEATLAPRAAPALPHSLTPRHAR